MSNKTITSGAEEDVFSLALRHYGSASGVADLLRDNSQVIQVDGTINQFRQTFIVGNAGAPPSEPEIIAIQTGEQDTPLGDNPFRSGSQQTLFDVALHQYGGLAGLAYLLSDNPDLIDSDSGTFRQFRQWHVIREEVFVNSRIKKQMLRLKPSSEGPIESEAWITEDGVEWWTDDNQPWVTGS